MNDGVAGHRYWKFTPLTYGSDGGGQVIALDYYDANGVSAMPMATVLASNPNWANALDNNAGTTVAISKSGGYYLSLDFKAKVEWSDDGASWTESGFSRPAVCIGGYYCRIVNVAWQGTPASSLARETLSRVTKDSMMCSSTRVP